METVQVHLCTDCRLKNLALHIRLMAAVKNLSAIMMGSSFLKQIAICLVLLRATTFITSFEDNVTDYSPYFSCNYTHMKIGVQMPYPFEGSFFVQNKMFHPNCSYVSPYNSTMDKVELELPYNECGIRSVENPEAVEAILVFQIHRLIETALDFEFLLNCTVPTYNYSQIEYDTPPLDLPIVTANIEVQLESELFESVGSEPFGYLESVPPYLYLIVNVNYISKNNKTYNGVIVHDCLSHDTATLDEGTTVRQLSDPFGCASPFYPLPVFNVLYGTEGAANLSVYSIFYNGASFLTGNVSITCGVTLCEDHCEPNCEVGSTPGHLSAIASYRPDSLEPESTFYALARELKENLLQLLGAQGKFNISLMKSVKHFFSLTAFYDIYRMITGQRRLITTSVVLSRHAFNSST